MSTLRLPAPLTLVPAITFAAKFVDQRRQFPYLPDPHGLVDDLNRLNAAGGVPATVDGDRVRLYSGRCVAGLTSSRDGDAWTIGFIDPMRIKDHAALSRGAIRLVTQGWYFYPELAHLRGWNNFRSEIMRAWAQRDGSNRVRAEDPWRRQVDVYCDRLDQVVEAGRKIETERARQIEPIAYRAVEAVAEQRRDTAGEYAFRLARPARVEQGLAVEVRNFDSLRGNVTKVEGRRLTVRFTRAVDRRSIPEQGELVASVNAAVARVQRDAIQRLREMKGTNPRLAPILVAGQFADVPPPATDVQPHIPLDPEQLDAFRLALAAPDLLVVLGPPGTGKTRTITAIARACAALGERVLIASQTNTAVDNVLEQLPPSVRGLRVGNETRIAERVQHLTLVEISKSLRQSIRDRTAPGEDALRGWLTDETPATAPLARLHRELTDIASADAAQKDAAQRCDVVEQPIRRTFKRQLAPAERAAAKLEQRRDKADRSVAKLTHRYSKATARSDGLFGVWYRLVGRWWARRLEAATQARTTVDDTLANANAQLNAVRAEMEAAVENDPSVKAARRHAAAADAAVARTRNNAKKTVDALTRVFAAAVTVPPPDSYDHERLSAFARRCGHVDATLKARADLLRDWRAKLDEPTEELNHELVRYADVVGATCIGVGIGSNKIADIEFDVAIVDEAGQISLPSTLVPLVHARRAILVGDHHQLPPFVDDEVREWLARNGTADDEVRRILAVSAFEGLFDVVPPESRILLRRQRRMPAEVAGFVSQQFYGGQLETLGDPRAPALFGKPLAIIDTSDAPVERRTEQARNRTESWQSAGYENHLEADIITGLMQWYAQSNDSWAVIVPYRAQLQLVTGQLRSKLGDQAVSGNVGTVDAFQGGERDIILYGFTRSNAARHVGFLGELRRLNVAITRARRQLVLVGDFSTLREARHAGFREMVRALQAHATAYGEVHTSRSAADLLRDARSAAR